MCWSCDQHSRDDRCYSLQFHEQAVVRRTLRSDHLQVIPYTLLLSSSFFNLGPCNDCYWTLLCCSTTFATFTGIKTFEENHFRSVGVLRCYLFTPYWERKLPNNKGVLLLQSSRSSGRLDDIKDSQCLSERGVASWDNISYVHSSGHVKCQEMDPTRMYNRLKL